MQNPPAEGAEPTMPAEEVKPEETTPTPPTE